MNFFQKLAVFILRLVGFTMLVVAAVGLGYYSICRAFGNTGDIPLSQLWGSYIWFAEGGILYAVSKPVGRALGNGLD